MKKAKLSICLFIITFVVTYIASCYIVPGWQIKLEADKLTYFIESLKTLVPVKIVVALVAGFLISFIPTIIQKIKKT